MKVFRRNLAFEWDQGNSEKNLKKHGVSDGECEEVFFDPSKKIAKDVLHSGKESRYILLGMTCRLRLLFIVFTIRKGHVRVISARDVNKKEMYLYEKKA